MRNRIAIILNAGSGKTSTTIAQLTPLLTTHGIDATVVSPESGADVSDLANSLMRSGHELIVAAGGDGTVSAVASALAGNEFILGILPLGTRNHFARDAGIPLTLPEAVSTLANGRVVQMDVGDVNGRVFINNISLGLYPAFVEERGDVRRRTGMARWYTIAAAAMTVLSSPPILRARATVDGRPLKRITPVVFVGNNEYVLEGASLGRRKALDGGNLSITMTRPHGVWGLARMVIRAALGKLRGAKDLDTLLGQEIEVRTKGWRALVAVDGEVTNDVIQPLRCAVRPGALRVLVPASPPKIAVT